MRIKAGRVKASCLDATVKLGVWLAWYRSVENDGSQTKSCFCSLLFSSIRGTGRRTGIAKTGWLNNQMLMVMA